jgi:N12 class adenine-specific DNA methylase
MTAFEEKAARHDRNLAFGPTDDFGPLFAENFVAPADVQAALRESRDDLPVSLRETAQPKPRSEEGPKPGDLFGAGVFFERRPSWKNRGLEQPKSFPARPSRASPSLFDLPATRPAVCENPKRLDEAAPTPDLIATEEYNGANTHSEERKKHERQSLSLVIASGEKGKARDILTAIRILKVLQREERPATWEEKETLIRFAGFGAIALSIFPDPRSGRFKDDTWQTLGLELRALLTPEEYDSAKRTTFNAFYTSPIVISSVHEALSRLGIPENATVLEPGCGVGNFMALAPCEMQFIGVELDLISGKVAKAIHPGHDIRIENFRDTYLPEGSIDAVVGNVPFADTKLDYRGERLSLHDFFLAKSIDALRPAGIAALVTTHFTLDKQNGKTREYLSSRADFVGAVRLPSDAFKREGTAVVTDILFLRRRAAGAPENHIDRGWLKSAPFVIDGVGTSINRYFLSHPEMVLGTFSRKDTLYGGEGYSVIGSGDLALALKKAIERLPEYPKITPVAREPKDSHALSRPPPTKHLTEGSFFVAEDRTICQVVNGGATAVVYGGRTLRANGTLTGRRFSALLTLRDRAREVLRSQNEGSCEGDRAAARRELNWAYDRFESVYGPINKTTFGKTAQGQPIRRMPNLVKFREDPDAMLVMSLEHYDEAIGRATKAAIMKKDVVGKTPPITRVESAEEGLLVSLNERGVVDLGFISVLYGKKEDVIVSELGDLICRDPESNSWETADAYLSGNVREKLKIAEETGPAFQRNVERLRTVQPEDVLPGDIDANLGAPWIPERDIQAFAGNLFRVELSSIAISHLAKDALWTIDADYAAHQSVAATSEYGTNRANGVNLFELALNMKTPVVYDTVNHGDREERVLNQEETLAAREKQKLIKERFRSWVFSDAERTERLVRIYNDTYNNLRPRLFDGSHLTFPGMNTTIELRPHQKNAVWRGMSSGNTLLAHAVGAGKTFTMAATGMKMKQAGLLRKPMYVVPNHLLSQFAREFMQLYPNAKLLIAAKEDFTRERRKLLTAKIGSGEWDGIIVTHSSFERIAMSRDYQERFLLEQIREYDGLLIEHAAQKVESRNLIKSIEKQKAARAERLKDLLATEKKDDGLVFDELGVDHIFIDEAQYFKNLETPTKMERVAGIQTGGSERAFDLYMKARYLHEEHAGHGVTFATGTPISNTMVEMYTMQRYLDPEGLRSRGLEHFDAWAATFGEVIEAMEISPDGKTLKPRSRFARFTNLPELQQMFRMFSDVETAEMLNLPRPRLQTGKQIVVSCPMSDEQRELQGKLVERYERLRSQKVDPRIDNALNITTDGRKLAIDARMLIASAGDFSGSKVNALAENVFETWKRTGPIRATQMIFCDMGVHHTPWGYSAYDEIRKKLCVHGIPRDEIAAIGSADSDLKKQALFEMVRAGQVRVLIGSTQKMGTGTNVQRRLIALHHLDAPWKPAEVEQRDGRILRQGNENEEVAVYRYVTEGSFDAYMWQALETKARFINQVITGENPSRSAEDIGGQELSYAEVKAIASGNPAVLVLAEADAEIKRLTVLKKKHMDEQFVARRNVRELPATIERLTERLRGLTADAEIATAHADEPITVGVHACLREELLARLGNSLDSVPKHVSDTRRFPLGIYHGLKFGLVLHPHFSPDIYLEGQTILQAGLLREHQGPRAIINALQRLAGNYDSERSRIRQDISVATSQLDGYQSRLGLPFPHEVYLSELAPLANLLRRGLSSKPSEPSTELNITEVINRVKALFAGTTH